MVVVLIVSVLAAVAIPMMRGRIDEAKWTEGRTTMGTIATAIRVYAREKQDTGAYGANLPSMGMLGFIPTDFKGSYFDSSNFSWDTAYSSSSNPPLTFTITATAPVGITTPSKRTLNHIGQWTETP
jgi:type II secretory pathway pseudopilin PulG